MTSRPPSALRGELLMSIQNGTLQYAHRGVVMQKNPFDIALYQMLIWREKPRTIIEIGSNEGGSALWLADLLALFGVDGHVHSLDLKPPPLQPPRNLSFHQGDARRVATIFPAEWLAAQPRPLLVIEDADHIYETTRAVLAHFAPLLRRGEYLIVEDAILTAMQVDHLYDGGPKRAIDEFLSLHADFEIDADFCDYFGPNVTWNVDGYLRKIA